MHAEGVEEIVFSGGECTLFRYLEELILYAKQLDLKVAIFTNGSLGKYKYRIFDLLDRVIISVDGRKEIHDSFRGVKGSYDKIINLLEFLKEKDINTSVQVSVGKFNYSDLSFIGDLCHEYKNIDSISVASIISLGNAKKTNLLLGNNDYYILINEIERILNRFNYHININTNISNSISIKTYLDENNIYNLPLFFDLVQDKYYLLNQEIGYIDAIESFDEKKLAVLVKVIMDRIRDFYNNKYEGYFNIEDIMCNVT